MDLDAKAIIDAVARLNNESPPSLMSLHPAKFLTERGTVVKVTQSVTEAVTASIASSTDHECMPTCISLTEIDFGGGDYQWLVESDYVEASHELAQIARHIVSSITSLEQIESFDFTDINSKKNDWVMSIGYPAETVHRIINDLQSSLFAYEMAGFIHQDIKPDQIQVKQVDGESRIVLSSPLNQSLEDAFKATRLSIAQLNPNCRDMARLTVQDCYSALEMARSASNELNESMDSINDDRFTPSNPVSLRR